MSAPLAATFGPYPAICVRVIDGDTFVADLDLGFDTHRWITVRLHGVNAPEHNRPGGEDARAFLDTALDGKSLLIQGVGRDMSFARYVCDVWATTKRDSHSVADLIIEAGHGKSFDPKHDHWER